MFRLGTNVVLFWAVTLAALALAITTSSALPLPDVAGKDDWLSARALTSGKSGSSSGSSSSSNSGSNRGGFLGSLTSGKKPSEGSSSSKAPAPSVAPTPSNPELPSSGPSPSGLVGPAAGASGSKSCASGKPTGTPVSSTAAAAASSSVVPSASRNSTVAPSASRNATDQEATACLRSRAGGRASCSSSPSMSGTFIGYHGTSPANKASLEKGIKAGANRNMAQQLGLGFYVADDPSTARLFAGTATPLMCIITADTAAWASVPKAWIPQSSNGQQLWTNYDALDRYAPGAVRFSTINGPGNLQLAVPDNMISRLGLKACCGSDCPRYQAVGYNSMSSAWNIQGTPQT